ncbi:hypothetical protein LIER_13323 [Lithospermum erythrorhizon]|uniref:Uncharacterized protein n=1 Tax=Lithospermum erythrorhizon TaxID=34254 RepID=A0AAV3PVF7_LITER
MESRLNDGDMGESPQDLDVISGEPLAIRPPSSSTTESSQARTNPSTSQTAEPVQGDANAGKSGDTPTIIRESLPVEFSDEDLVNFRRRVKVVKKVSKDIVVTASPPAVASQSSSLSRKRPAIETRPPLFSK